MEINDNSSGEYKKETEPTIIDGVEALQPTVRDVNTFFYTEFDFSQGDLDVQNKYNQWCASKGFFHDLEANKLHSLISKDIKPPKNHVVIEQRSADLMKAKGGFFAAVLAEKKDAERAEAAKIDLADQILKRDSKLVAGGRYRADKGNEIFVQTDKAKYDTWDDQHGSIIRRIFIKKPDGEFRGGHRIHDKFAEEFLEVLEEVKQFRDLDVRNMRNWPEEKLEAFFEFDKKVSVGGVENSVRSIGMIQNLQSLVAKWVENHPGTTKEDFFAE